MRCCFCVVCSVRLPEVAKKPVFLFVCVDWAGPKKILFCPVSPCWTLGSLWGSLGKAEIAFVAVLILKKLDVSAQIEILVLRLRVSAHWAGLKTISFCPVVQGDSEVKLSSARDGCS